MQIGTGISSPIDLEVGRFDGVRRSAKKRPKLTISAAEQARRVEPRLTKRDLAVVNALYVIGVLSRHQIQRMWWPHLQGKEPGKVVANRLNTLFKYHVVDCNVISGDDMRMVGMEPCDVYNLSSTGYEVVNLSTKEDIFIPKKKYRKGFGVHTMLLHDVMVAEIYTRFLLEGGDLEKNGMAQVRWGSEWVGRISGISNGKAQVWAQPDGMLMVRTPDGRSHHAALELDRNSVNKLSRWKQKVAGYEKAKTRGNWKGLLNMEQFPVVLAVVPTGYKERVAQAVMQENPTVQWLLKDWNDILTHGVFAQWDELASGRVLNLCI